MVDDIKLREEIEEEEENEEVEEEKMGGKWIERCNGGGESREGLK